jgi:beta-propeller uncharacterized protein DUF5122/List-Bact-rpt repeat protein
MRPLRPWVAVVLALAAVAVAPAAAQAASDEPLATGWATDGTVFATAVDGSGRTYLGGSFTHVYAPTIGGLKLTTSSDQADLTFPPVNNTVLAVASDGGGGWFIGGSFTAVGDVTRNHLAHILSDGSLDPTWDPNANSTVNALAVSGTDVYVGGDFTTLNGSTTRNHLAKIPIAGNGTVDASWDPNANSTVNALAVSGTDVYVGGNFTTLNTPAVTRNRLARIPTSGNGTVDASWNPNVNGPVNALAVSGSDVYLGGGFSMLNGATARGSLAKIPLSSSTGTVDPDWNPNANGTVNALAVSGSDVYVGGNFSTLNGGTAPRLFLAKIPTAGDGTVDPDWAPNANNIVDSLAVAGSDVYVGGFFTTLNGGATARNFLAKIPAAGDGTVDAGWDPNPNNIVHALATSGSDIYAGGEFTRANVTTRNRLARLNADGSLDASWDPNANDSVVELALSGSDLYVGGIFTTLNTPAVTRNRLAKIPTSGSGTVDPSWDPNANLTVNALAVSGTDVYVGGPFSTLNGSTTRSRLAKIPTAGDGTVDPDWNPNADGFPGVGALAVSGSDVYVGGTFTTVGGQSRNRIARLSSSGTGAADPSWNPNADSVVGALAISGTRLAVGGGFTTMGTRRDQGVALFTLQHTITVSKTGTGAGNVVSSPAGIDCGATCSAQFNDGGSVTLTATAASGSTFAGWSDPGCPGTGDCTLAMDQDTTVTATFNDTSPPHVNAPKQTLVRGAQLGTSTVPVRFAWTASDNITPSASISSTLQQRTSSNGSPWTAYSNLFGPSTAKTVTRSFAPASTVRQFRVTAKDAATNVVQGPAAPRFRVNAYQESSSAIAYSGNWRRTARHGAFGGSVEFSRQPGAKATLTATGRNLAVVMPLASTAGTARICVDGASCSRVDLSPASGLGPRKEVYARNGLAASTAYKVQVTVLSGRVDLDAFVALR